MSLTLHLQSSCTFISSLHQSHNFIILRPNSLNFTPKSRIRFVYPIRRKRVTVSASVNGYSAVQGSNSDETHLELGEKVRNFIENFRAVLPGGRWWKFDDDVQIEMMAKPVTVWKALSRMWELISEDRVLVFAAFAALIVTAVCNLVNYLCVYM